METQEKPTVRSPFTLTCLTLPVEWLVLYQTWFSPTHYFLGSSCSLDPEYSGPLRGSSHIAPPGASLLLPWVPPPALLTPATLAHARMALHSLLHLLAKLSPVWLLDHPPPSVLSPLSGLPWLGHWSGLQTVVTNILGYPWSLGNYPSRIGAVLHSKIQFGIL